MFGVIVRAILIHNGHWAWGLFFILGGIYHSNHDGQEE